MSDTLGSRPGDPPVTEADDSDEIDLYSVAESEIPEVREEAREWLIRNNRSDQTAILIFAAVLLALAVILQSWSVGLLGVCVAGVIPFRWVAAPHFERGDLRKGILWANVGSWYLLFPLVIIIPDTLPIAMQNLIGPIVLAATYLERALVRRLVPLTIAIAVAVSLISFTTDGFVEGVAPRWLALTVLTGYIGANLFLVMGDLLEFNLVHLRTLRRAVEQNRELRNAEQALRESRRRLLVAADEERIRLERDLHDGAQQRLVSLSMQLRLAAELSDGGQAPSSESLMALHRSAVDAVEELRDLAQGVYPARLKELGLAKALRAVARRSPVPIEIVDRTDGALDEGTLVALYFVCLEAIQNATKHGDENTSIRVEFSSDADDLVVTVADDGPGFDPAEQHGSRGVLNMMDRMSALGGELSIDSVPGRGTTVTAVVPKAFAEPVLAGARS